MTTIDDQWFDTYFNAIHPATWILDLEGRVTRANRPALELCAPGQEPDGATPLWSYPWPGLARQDHRTLKWAVRQALRGLPAWHEIEFHRKGQAKKIIRLSLKPIVSSPGGLHFILAEGMDISAYKHASEALNQSEARFKTIFDQAGIGILIKDINGRMLDCNPAFEAMLGYPAGEILNCDYLDITHPDDKQVTRKLFNELVNGKRTRYFIEKRYLRREGQAVWARVTASLVIEGDRQAQFVIAMVENIHTQKEIEAELNELQQRLMQGREMERLRLAKDLHDTPLQEVIGVTYQIQALMDTLPEGAEQEQLQSVQSSLYQLARSLRTICGELRPPALAPFGLEKTIRSHAEQFQQEHPELGFQLELAHDRQKLPEPVRIKLFRIYQEALNNILRHAQASQVTVRFCLEDGQAILEIRDDGAGFELPARWIKLARQGHLGIVGAREHAREVGGDLEVISTPGEGTLLRATIPYQENTEEKA